MKLNLGAGNDILDGFENHDITKLPGIDVVFDLNQYPWPWNDDAFEEVVANDLLEHLDNFRQLQLPKKNRQHLHL